ncbi:hypothetical protein [Nitrospirillum iridis]|uniref:Uncharacterized protein n=1 Tax=Nitrospirillum iridis TaxID=765888 RepID=A0A7X0AVD8_9PROT|nr:hypothetical protein [Nitrospirillum iridis]MBB6250775.1 hypothetical protein [Nitrospirillum iridis]
MSVEPTPHDDDQVPPRTPEAPKPPEVRHVKEADLSDEARQRIYACLAEPPSPYRSNNRWQPPPRRKKPQPS